MSKKEDQSMNQNSMSGEKNAALSRLPTIYCVSDEGDEVSFIYSFNNPNPPGTEFLVTGVPRGKRNAVAEAISFLSGRNVTNAQRIQSNGLLLMSKLMKEDEKKQLQTTQMATNYGKVPLFELIPMYQNSTNWGSRPFAPQGCDELVASIIKKWSQQVSFVWFIDGNPGNCAIFNLKWIGLAEALEHIGEWKVDWDMNLTEEERDFVVAHTPYFLELASVEFVSITPH